MPVQIQRELLHKQMQNQLILLPEMIDGGAIIIITIIISKYV